MPVRTPLNQELSSSYALKPSTMEDIDYAVYNYVNDSLNIFTDTNKGFEKVPVIYSIPERAYQIKNSPDLRTDGRTLIYPMISILRSNMVQDPSNKGIYGVNVLPYFDYYNQGGSITIAKRVNQDKTKNFANANAVRGHRTATGNNKNFQTFPHENPNIVYDTLMIPMPTFIEVTYTIGIVTEYQQQMNEIISPFITRAGTPNRFKIDYEGNSYEALLESDFTQEGNASGLNTAERLFKTNVTMKVLGYLISADKNEDTPVIVHRQSPAKLRIQRERTIVGDQPHFNPNSKDKYRS
jgi:hypothetical protein